MARTDIESIYDHVASRIFEEKSDPNRSVFQERPEGKPPELGMGYGGQSGLTFKALRAANLARCPLFKNAKGELQHSGRDWSPNDWMVAVTGELGEAANVMKKVRRGDMAIAEARDKLAQELSDVVIYLDMLAASCDVNLGKAVMETFNAKSDQLELDLYITETGYSNVRA